MKRSFFRQYWPVSLVFFTMLVSNILLVSFVTVQAFNPANMAELQRTPGATPVPIETAVIPNTGGSVNSLFVGTFSSWFLWAVLGMALLFFLFLHVAKAEKL